MNKWLEKGKRFIHMDSQIQITGSSSVMVDGCKKILEYNDILVKVKTWDLIVQVWGSGLTVSGFSSDIICIYGDIRSVELERVSA